MGFEYYFTGHKILYAAGFTYSTDLLPQSSSSYPAVHFQPSIGSGKFLSFQKLDKHSSTLES